MPAPDPPRTPPVAPSATPSLDSAFRRRLVTAAVLGLAAGFLAGLFGVGGGILIVPVLVLAMRMDQRAAHATSLTAVLPLAISGVIGFAAEDSIDWAVSAFLISGAMVGAIVGTHWLHKLPGHILAYAFASVGVLSALRLVLDGSDAIGRSALGPLAVVGYIALGLLSGTLAGLLGVGGGVVMVPAMILLGGIPAAIAKGTSLVVIIPTSVVGTMRNRRSGSSDLAIAATVGVAGVASAFLASKVSVGLDEGLSNALFASLLSVVALRMVVDTRRGRDERPTG